MASPAYFAVAFEAASAVASGVAFVAAVASEAAFVEVVASEVALVVVAAVDPAFATHPAPLALSWPPAVLAAESLSRIVSGKKGS